MFVGAEPRLCLCDASCPIILEDGEQPERVRQCLNINANKVFRHPNRTWEAFLKGHRRSKNLEAKPVSHVFSPGFSATCWLWLMPGSERENSDSIVFMHKWSNTQ